MLGWRYLFQFPPDDVMAPEAYLPACRGKYYYEGGGVRRYGFSTSRRYVSQRAHSGECHRRVTLVVALRLWRQSALRTDSVLTLQRLAAGKPHW